MLDDFSDSCLLIELSARIYYSLLHTFLKNQNKIINNNLENRWLFFFPPFLPFLQSISLADSESRETDKGKWMKMLNSLKLCLENNLLKILNFII